MGLQVGVVGLPNVGKTLLFNLLTGGRAEVAGRPFSTISPNRGVAGVPDERLEILARILNPPQVVPATVEFVDVAGLVEGASRGEGLGNQFLSYIRGVDAVVEVLRFFENATIPHVLGSLDPLRDRDIVDMELALSDLEIIERRLEKLSDLLRKTKDEKLQRERDVLQRCHENLSRGEPLRVLSLSPEEEELIRPYQFITAKPIIYVANLSEDRSSLLLFEEAKKNFEVKGLFLIPIWVRLESELQELDEEEREAFFQEFGIPGSGFPRLVQEAYRALGLITFYTYGDKELRARELVRGTKAPQAAGKVHTDMEKGFIKAEVINFEEFLKYGSLERARQEGKIRYEGRDYEVQDGDILYFRFALPH